MDDKNKNNKNDKNKATRHTWIGDEEEVRQQEAMTERRTYTLSPQATRIVEKQRKKRTGFITDEELKNSEVIKIEGRRTAMVNKEDISQTRIYDPFEKGAGGIDADKKAEREPKPEPVIITIPKTKAKAFIAALIIVLVLLAFEAGFFVMKSKAASLPAETKALKTQSAELKEENSQLKDKAASYGDEEQLKELKESWERLKTKLETSE